MKQKWAYPKANLYVFTSNEYVAACYSLYCLISGDGEGTFVQNGYPTQGSTKDWAGTTITFNWQDEYNGHGHACAEGSSYNTDTGVFKENNKGSVVDNITIGADAEKTASGAQKKYAVWTSVDINGSGTYNHYGYAIEDQPNKPNHS